MTIRVYVGDTDLGLAKVALGDNPTAFLINRSNYKEFLTTEYSADVVAFTALGDLPKDLEIFYNILLKSDEIVYAPPEHWSDNQSLTNVDPTTTTQGLTENLLLCVSNYRPVKNIEHCYLTTHLTPLVDSRKTNATQLWIAGCSYTYGVGVDATQRYGQLLADKLGLDCSFLARPGSSIQWAADQITRSDIRPGDIVIWGITDAGRLPYFYNDQYLPLTCTSYTEDPNIEKILPFKELFSENELYHNIFAVERTVNFCKKAGAELGMVGFLPQMPNFYRYIKTKSNYVDLPHNLIWKSNSLKPKYQDLGTDGNHPGPIQHQHYKNFILNHFDFLKTRQATLPTLC